MSDIRSLETAWVPMPDGTRLAARIWMPATAPQTPLPAILEYIPYRRRDRTRMRDESMHPRLAEAGYVSVRIDARGAGDSDGLMHDEYSDQEIQDGHDAIAWIAAQDWCDGKVGMFGKSWGAYSSFQVAATRPPALKAIAPVMGTDDRWLEDIHFYGGVLTNDNFWWGSIMQMLNAQPPDPLIVGEDRWREIWKTRLDAMTFWPAQWLEHQSRDHMWQRGSVSEDYAAVEIPVYYFGGWADLFRDTPFRIAQNLKGPVKVLMGPWAHLYPHEGIPAPRVDFMDEMIRWWDHWLKDKDTGLLDEPLLRFWMQDGVVPAGYHAERPGRWVEEAAWPSPDMVQHGLWLNASGLDARPDHAGPKMQIASPTDYGKAAGDMCSFATAGDWPVDQRHDAGGALVLRGAPLDADIEILGQPSVDLLVSADRAQGFVAVTLVDEAPDGTQSVITRGFANLTHRNGPQHPKPVVPGQQMQITVPLHGIAQRVSAGHRLMVHVATNYWPILWPSPQIVTLSLAPGRSRLNLPLRASTAAAHEPRPFAAPPAAAPRKSTPIRAGSLERNWHMDLATGTLTQRVYIDGGVFGPVGENRLDETGTEMGDISERIYEIGTDPLSARAQMKQSTVFRRPDWNPRIETWSEMTATQTHFVLRASVTCHDGDALFHHVDWHHEIPRNGM